MVAAPTLTYTNLVLHGAASQAVLFGNLNLGCLHMFCRLDVQILIKTPADLSHAVEDTATFLVKVGANVASQPNLRAELQSQAQPRTCQHILVYEEDMPKL